jgi:predicted ester cyclase
VGAALKKFPDMHVEVEDVIVEGEKVVVRNTWQGTEVASGKKFRFGGIVIWRVADGKLAERWAHLESPKVY